MEKSALFSKTEKRADILKTLAVAADTNEERYSVIWNNEKPFFIRDGDLIKNDDGVFVVVRGITSSGYTDFNHTLDLTLKDENDASQRLRFTDWENEVLYCRENHYLDFFILDNKLTKSSGINWTWVSGMTTEMAENLHEWFLNNGYETRGIYNDDDGTRSIRYR